MTQVSNISAAFAITLRNQLFRMSTGQMAQAETGQGQTACEVLILRKVELTLC